MRHSPVIKFGYIAVVAVLVLATSAFMILDKSVKLTVNGESRKVHRVHGDVGDLLNAADVETGQRDIVAPSRDAKLSRGMKVVVRHARKLTLDLDGQRRTIWVTALTVEEALRQLRVDSRAVVSVSRSRRVPRSGMPLTVRTQRQVTVVADKKKQETVTTATTVRDLLAQAGVQLGQYDLVQPAQESFPHAGTEVKVTRLLSAPVTKKIKVKAPTEKRKTDKMIVGKRKVLQKGKAGLKEVKTAHVRKKGRKVKAVVQETVLKKPVPWIIKVGTKTPGVGGDADRLNWAGLARCESGGNPRAVNSSGGYYGLYQFSLQTWRSVGGTGLPTEASPAEQTYRAKLLYKKVGGRWQGQWPVCGRHLFD